jgi:hypothetical protein
MDKLQQDFCYKPTRKSLTFIEKYEIINCFDECNDKKSIVAIADDLHISRGTLRTILENRDVIFDTVLKGGLNPKKIRKKNSCHPLVDEALYIWIKNIEENPQYGLIINTDILKETVQKFQMLLENKSDISFSYIERWKKRFNVKSYRIYGESSGNDNLAVNTWKSTLMPHILKKYLPRNIYNIDESALFWKALPNRSFFSRGGSKHGVKEGRERMTVVLTVNMVGDRLKPFVIGKSANPRSFPKFNLNQRFHYDSSPNAWITNSIFMKYMNLLNREFSNEGREVAMILDNCTCHHAGEITFPNITFFYLPPNTTSIIQPLDAGFMRVFIYIRIYMCYIT